MLINPSVEYLKVPFWDLCFFLLYINDLHKSPNKLQFYLFADDTSLICANGDLKTKSFSKCARG